LNLFPFFVFLSPRPHTIGAATLEEEAQGVSDDAPLINHRAATVHRCITLAPLLAIHTFLRLLCCLLPSLALVYATMEIIWARPIIGPLLNKYRTPRLLNIPPIFTAFGCFSFLFWCGEL